MGAEVNMDILEKVKNGSMMATNILVTAYKDVAMNTAQYLTTTPLGGDALELTNTLLASMIALEELATTFQGESITEFDAYVARNLAPTARDTLHKICEYRKNYTPEELASMAQTDRLAQMISSADEAVQDAPEAPPHEKSSTVHKISNAVGSVISTVRNILFPQGPVAPSMTNSDSAICGDMVVHLRPILNTNGSETKL